MATVTFHFNVPQRQDYTCRLLRKAYRSGARVAVTGDAQLLAELDRLLWVFDPIDFVPHWRGASVERLPARLSVTPIVLLEDAQPGGGHEVLVSLADAVPPHATRFGRVIEVVSRSEAERARARERWREYARLGFEIEKHEAGA